MSRRSTRGSSLEPLTIVNPAPTLALVDYDSLVNGPYSASAYDDAAELLWSIVSNAVTPKVSESAIHEVTCRLYGGWNAADGTPTEHRAWMLRSLKTLRGLRKGIRLVPTIADSLLVAPSLRLDGTYNNRRQKMTDAMLSIDAMSSLRTKDHSSLVIVSDDDDFVPVVLTISVERLGWVCWIRQRAAAANDRHFDRDRIELLRELAWT